MPERPRGPLGHMECPVCHKDKPLFDMYLCLPKIGCDRISCDRCRDYARTDTCPFCHKTMTGRCLDEEAIQARVWPGQPFVRWSRDG